MTTVVEFDFTAFAYCRENHKLARERVYILPHLLITERIIRLREREREYI